MVVRLSSAASEDLFDGYCFYEDQADGIGVYFVESLLVDIKSLEHNAGIHPIRYGKHHQLLAKRFPFAVFYRIVESTILVDAVLDCRRSPEWITKRLR